MIDQHWFRAELDRAATQIAVYPDPSRAIRQAQARSRRRRAGFAVVGAFALGAGGVGAYQFRQNATDLAIDTNPNVVDEAETAQLASPEPEVERIPLDIDWRLVDIESPINAGGLPGSLVAGTDGMLYALSSAPGVRLDDVPADQPLPQAVYRSADGETWEVVPQEEGRSLSFLGERGGLLYAVSTAPTAESVATTVTASEDGGQSWVDLADLPPVGPPPGPADLFANTYQRVELAVGDQALVATRLVSYSPDSAKLAELVEAAEGTIVNIFDGHYVVIDEARESACYENLEDCPELQDFGEESATDGSLPTQPGEVDRGTTAELGVDGELDQVEHLVSVDAGATWHLVEVPAAEVRAVDGGFVAAGNNGLWDAVGPPYRSANGADWTEISVPEGVTSAHGTVGGQLLVSGATFDEATGEPSTMAFLGTGDGGWEELDLHEIFGAADISWPSFAVGELGAVITAHAGDAIVIATSADGVTWSVSNSEEHGADPGAIVVDSTVGTDRFSITVSYHDESSARQPADTWVLIGTPRR